MLHRQQFSLILQYRLIDILLKNKFEAKWLKIALMAANLRQGTQNEPKRVLDTDHNEHYIAIYLIKTMGQCNKVNMNSLRAKNMEVKGSINVQRCVLYKKSHNSHFLDNT